jgi:periplasmic protein CpxP/Spy
MFVRALGPLLETSMFDVKAALPKQGSAWAKRLMAISVVAVAATVIVVTAHAQDHGPGMHGPEGHDMGGPGMMFGGPPQHMAHMIDHMLDGLGASDAQRSQIKQIAMSAAADLKAQRTAGKGLHDQAMQVFTSATVDAGAAESLRQQMLAQHDQSSKRMMQAMLDISNVLTPSQRAKIGERMHERQAIQQERMQRMERMQGMPRGERPAANGPQK